MKNYDRLTPVNSLPDVFLRSAGSNNTRILDLDRNQISKITAAARDVRTILSLENAFGRTLDLYGARLGLQRGGATDDQFRILLKAKIARNLCNGSIPAIIRCLSLTFGCDPAQIRIEEYESAGVIKSISFPLEDLNAAGFTISQATEIVRSMLPVGVAVESTVFAGTFEFSENENDYDEQAGFDFGSLGALPGEEFEAKITKQGGITYAR